MKCIECGKPDAKRDHVGMFMGRRHWVSFCSQECRTAYYRHKAEYAETVNHQDPFKREPE